MNFWVHTLKLFLFPLKAKSWTLGSLELAASHSVVLEMLSSSGWAAVRDQHLPLRRDCHAGCGQRPGRGGGSLGALPRCSFRPVSLSADFRSVVYSIHVRTTSTPDAAFAHLLQDQDNYSVFGSVAADGSTVAWEYVQAKWDALSAQYSQIVVGRILCVSIANFHTEQAAKAVEAFLVGYPKARLPAR
ncbi:hypothetical protein DYB35_014074 [Aphanomyces astaci]|uniref:ERAP1-like C-terminal domain-containing protein n=1 Tax=Aphanomyces astaci TaxID=112090 RepID=A0A418DXX9_APHAT|nr:hypothetical protein DYB35_014074 [Aphanomyces astaci]